MATNLGQRLLSNMPERKLLRVKNNRKIVPVKDIGFKCIMRHNFTIQVSSFCYKSQYWKSTKLLHARVQIMGCTNKQDVINLAH